MSEPQGFDLLWEDGPCFVVAKPGGVLTQSPPGIDSLEIRIKQYLAARHQRAGKVYLGVPHRIDRPASGALVMASQVRAARSLSEQFEDRTVKKTYWALVQGHVQAESGTWRDFVRKVPGEARAETVADDHPEGRSAILHYRIKERLSHASWLEIQLETGRTHQIRLQASTRGFPILGDYQYGANQSFGPEVSEPRDRWIALHARQISFHHPTSRERVEVTAPMPAWWDAYGPVAESSAEPWP
jgi:23S rRNA pseudouridine1911/1915/1917 synthase